MTPASVAVLVGVPIEWPSFLRAAFDPQRDYLRRFAADPEPAWSRPGGYAQTVATPLRALLEQARGLGAHCIADARLEDLADASRRFDAVIVLAHWKGAGVAAEDLIVIDAAAIAGRLDADPQTATVAMQIRSSLPRSVFHHKLAALGSLLRSAEDGPKRLASLLNRHVLEPAPAAEPAPGAFRVVARPETIAAARRACLDTLLGGLLRPGNRLELADGLVDAQTVDAHIAANFDGVLDLTSCEAHALANHLDHQRFGALRIVQFERPLVPEMAAITIVRTVQRMADGEHDYLHARTQALHEVFQAVETEVARTGAGRLLLGLRRSLRRSLGQSLGKSPSQSLGQSLRRLLRRRRSAQ